MQKISSVSAATGALLILMACSAAPLRAAAPVSKQTQPSVVGKSQGAGPFYLSGVWVLADTFMDKQDESMVATPGRLSESKPEDFAQYMQSPVLKGDYQRQHERAVDLTARGIAVDDMGAMCLPQGMPMFWGGPYAYEFVQTKTQLNLSQEWNEQTRRIYLDGRPHPPSYDPSFNGHSVGHWEGSTLVVDTVGIRADTKIGLDSHHSDAVHIVERFRKTAPDLLAVEMTVDDPKAFRQPWIAHYRLRHKPGMEIQEYSCEDNNRNAVDANGVTQAIIAPK